MFWGLPRVEAQPAATGFPALSVPPGTRGEAAVTALGANLPEVARQYRKSPEELRALLRRDHSLRLDARGRLHYCCEGLAGAAGAGAPAGTELTSQALAPLEQTFLLHSKPGANRTIYLDFDGHTLSGNGWTANYNGGSNIVAPAWDMDGTPGVFSTAELTAIQQIWLRVAEDYAGFDVDVTTEYPGEAALTRANNGDQVYGTRALISAISSYFGNYGGIAYVGAFNDVGDYYKPALIFPERLGHNEKNIAEAISHEVGHNLGLSHDGTTTGTEYYTGHGEWAPIMGVGYYRPITHWSRGEYANANNTQDDLVIITQNGLAYRADDHGNTIGTARMLAGFNVTTNGIIERNTDVDFFGFSTFGGAAVVTVAPWELGANLHLVVSVYNSAGVLLTNREVADTSAGVQPVSVGLTFGAGTYYVSVAGGGSGNPYGTGYTNYGSLGNYSLTLNLPPVGQWLPVAGGNYSWPTGANWINGGVPNTVDAVANVNNNITGPQVIQLPTPVTLGRLVLGDADGSDAFTINSSGAGLTFDVASGAAQLVKSSGAADFLNLPLTLADDLVISNSSALPLTVAGGIHGNKTLTKTGSGPLHFAGTNSYTGATRIEAGTIQLAATAAFSAGPILEIQTGAALDVTALSSGLSLGSDAQLRGSGTVVGDLVAAAGAQIQPGGVNQAGTLTIDGNLHLAGGAVWGADLAADPDALNAHDRIAVTGDLILSGPTQVGLNALEGVLTIGGSYPLLTYGGSLVGTVADVTFSNPTRLEFSADDSVAGEVRVHVSGAPGALVWRGNGAGNQWDLATTPNWRLAGDGATFLQLDQVTFDAAGSNNSFINLLGELRPGLVTVNAAKNYTFGGAGRLTGAVTLEKLGAGLLTVSNANDFTGPVRIRDGTLRTAHPGALGAASGATWVTNSGVLDLYGRNLAAEPIFISGAGTGAGAVLNSGGTQTNALRFITLTGDATVGGTGRWDVRANPTAAVVGNEFALSKVGSGQIWFADVGAMDLGDVEVRAGSLWLVGNSALADRSNPVRVFSGATLRFSNSLALTLVRPLQMTNATLNLAATNLIFSGRVWLAQTNTWALATELDVPGSVGGLGALVKTGAGTLILRGSNDFSGTWYLDSGSSTLAEGSVRFSGPEATAGLTNAVYLRNSGNGAATLQLDGGAMIPAGVVLNGRSNTVAAVRNLSDTNVIQGPVVALGGGTNYTFQSDAGTLQITGDLIYAGPAAAGRVYSFLGAGTTLVSGAINAATNGAAVALIKSGSGNLLLTATNNAWTGGTLIAAGTLLLGSEDSGGSVGTGSISNEATLAFNTQAELILTNEITGRGQLQQLAAGRVTLTGDNSYTGSTTIGVGTNLAVLHISHANALGSPTTGTTIGPGGGSSAARLELSGDIVTAEPISLPGRAADNPAAAIVNIAGTNTLTGNITLSSGGAVYNYRSDSGKLILAGACQTGQGFGWRTNQLWGAGCGEISGVIGGGLVGQAVVKYDFGTWILSASNTYAGPTVVADGTLLVNGAVGPGTVRVEGGVLGGGGVITGPVTVSPGATLSPGAGLGALTVSNDCTLDLDATVFIELNRALGLHDQILGLSNLSLQGTLVVTNRAGDFSAGDSFLLFEAASITGNFAALELPPLKPGLAWQFEPASGVLNVISTIPTTPPELSFSALGEFLELSWPVTHLGWRLEAQTNSPGAGIRTNWFEVTEAAATNVIYLPFDSVPGSVFFRLIYP